MYRGARLDWAAKQSVADAITFVRGCVKQIRNKSEFITAIGILNAFEVLIPTVVDVEKSAISYRKK